jgi:hypothetical protein
MVHNHNLGCVIISNSDDLCFLKANLEQITPIFKIIVISIGTKLWNGEAENETLISEFIEQTLNKYNNVSIIRYDIPNEEIVIMKNAVKSEMYWESHARWVAYQYLCNKSNTSNIVYDYILFLDSDEIVDGELFTTWLNTNEYKKYDVMKLLNYWYWRTPMYRAKEYYEDSVVFIKNQTFNPLHLFSDYGRHGLYECIINPSSKIRNYNFRGKPMIHHYSWVRTKEGMLRKVQSWGHRNDKKDWVALVEKEYSIPFNGTDFLKGLEYEEVDDIFSINLQIVP